VRKWPFELVLDLDETLVYVDHAERSVDARPPPGCSALQFNKHSATAHCRFMRPRPHLEKFLREASQRCRLNIYTAGSTPYAEEILRHIDPEGTLIQGEIQTRPPNQLVDPTNPPKKRLTKINSSDRFLRRAVIVDDQIAAWDSDFQDRVLIAKKFQHDFTAGAPRPPRDDFLLHLLSLFERIAHRHKRDTHIAQTLFDERHTIFEGLVIYLAEENPHPDFAKNIRLFNGKVAPTLGANVTHIAVSSHDAALRIPRGLPATIVHFSWIVDSFHAWCRQDEQNYKMM